MQGVRSVMCVFVLASVVASCGGATSEDSSAAIDLAEPSTTDSATTDSLTSGTDTSGTDTSGTDGAFVDGASNDTTPLSGISIGLEDRFGSGRALLAATNGEQAVVATTVGVFVRSRVDDAFRSLTPIGSGVRDLAISPDGSRVSVIANDGAIALWTIDGERLDVADLAGVASGDFRVDGSLVVAGSDAIRVVDAADGATVGEWPVPTDRALGPVAVADDGRVLISLAGGASPELAIWTGAGQAETVALDLKDAGVSVTRLDAAGDLLALDVRAGSGAFDGRIDVLTIGDSAASWSHQLGADSGREVWALTADGNLLVGEDSTVTIIGAGGAATGPSTTSSPIERLTPDGLVVLSNGSVLQRQPDGSTNEISPGTAPVTGLHVEPASDVSAIIDIDGRVRVVSSRSDEVVSIDDFTAAPVNDVAVAPDGRVATASADGVVSLRSSDGATTTSLVHDEGNVDSVAFTDGQDLVATAVAERRAATSWDDTVSVWDPADSSRLFEMGGEAEEVAGCAFFTNRLRFASDGSFVVSTSHDFTVHVNAVPSGELLHTFPPHANTVLDIAISSDDSTLVTSGDDSTMRVWDLDTYELIAEHPTTMGGYWSLSFLPDGRSVVAGDLSGNLSVVDLQTGAPTSTFGGTKLREARSAVSPDGRIVAAGADGSTVRLWSVRTGEIIGEATGHAGVVTAVAFFPESDRFVTSSKDGTSIVWRLST